MDCALNETKLKFDYTKFTHNLHMASIQRTAKGYRAFVYVKGTREDKTFRTKREALAWAAARETELRHLADALPSDKYTLADALRKYVEEVSPTKRGGRWEQIRVNAMLNDPAFPSGPIGSIAPEHIGQWRDARLKLVKAGTVLREIALVSTFFEHARLEWRWIKSNPLRDVRKPSRPDHRTVIITRWQIKAMLRVMGYSPQSPVRTVAQSAAVCFLLALRTGMRAGELCSLTWSKVFDDYCRLPITKTVPRDVPFTPKARRTIEKMRGFDSVLVFSLQVQTLDSLFRRYRERAGLSGFTFHDSRHTAATWMAQRVHVLDLCKAFGWSDTKQALVYYNPTASDIAKRMSSR